jgi:peptidoglycan/LPS O-acetylase OafA/YrhL
MMQPLSGGDQPRYDNLDGLRAYAAIGIVLMHVLSNGGYGLGGFVFDKLVPSFADLVFLFMVVSGFCVCCGYYEKTVTGTLDLWGFYAKRFSRAWPFFAVLCAVDLALSPSVDALYEVLANLTLCFGFIPQNGISVIGVGWFLGTVFVFYFLFPFICSLLADKKRAWIAFGAALLLSSLCVLRFGLERTSFAYSGVFFLAGGMLYLYRQTLSKWMDRFGWLILPVAAGGFVLYYLLGTSLPLQLALSVILTVAALGKKNLLLQNPVTKWLSRISMEVYLCHMVAFRLLEKLNVVRLFRSELLSYLVMSGATLALAIAMSVIINKLLSIFGGLLKKSGGNNHG